jgi:SAM-dependent methyltransferase
MKHLIYLVKHYLNMAREKGLLAAFHRLKNRFFTKYYERKFNISTEQNFSQQTLGYDEEKAEYGPVDYLSFIKTLSKYYKKAGGGGFLDYGCGLGRALFIASMYPFEKIIGVDLSPRLCQLANQNIAQSQNVKNIERLQVICTDATTYEVPNSVNAIFINNSFTGSVLEKVFDRILESYRKSPRDLNIICNLPKNSKFEKQIRARSEFKVASYYTDESNTTRVYLIAQVSTLS